MSKIERYKLLGGRVGTGKTYLSTKEFLYQSLGLPIPPLCLVSINIETWEEKIVEVFEDK